jgi:citrate lyase subunit beta / citryl-CoA lyase
MRELRRLRSLLFVPGGRADMIAKLGRSAPDGVVIDLEDAVPGAGKDVARSTTVEALETLDVPVGTLVLVRVNAIDSPWHADDVAAVAGTRADGVVQPKTETSRDLEGLRSALDTAGRPDAVIVAGLETARGVADAGATLAAAGAVGVVATYFGAEDYISDLGGRRTQEGTEVIYARSQVVLGARLAGILALDQIVVGVRDDDGFLADAEVGRSLGYSGKLCIHPRQVPLAHQVFTPSAAEVAQARAVVDAVGKAGGLGAVLVDGEMVDDVHLRMAQAVLARAEVSGHGA